MSVAYFGFIIINIECSPFINTSYPDINHSYYLTNNRRIEVTFRFSHIDQSIFAVALLLSKIDFPFTLHNHFIGQSDFILIQYIYLVFIVLIPPPLLLPTPIE